MTTGILSSLALVAALQASPAVPQQQPPPHSCTVGQTPTGEEKARRGQGVQLARTVHNLQIKHADAREKKFLAQEDLVLEPPPGWKLRLDLTPAGYWFMVTDTTDPCGFAFVSNQDGLIFEARPIR